MCERKVGETTILLDLLWLLHLAWPPVQLHCELAQGSAWRTNREKELFFVQVSSDLEQKQGHQAITLMAGWGGQGDLRCKCILRVIKEQLQGNRTNSVPPTPAVLPVQNPQTHRN